MIYKFIGEVDESPVDPDAQRKHADEQNQAFQRVPMPITSETILNPSPETSRSRPCIISQALYHPSNQGLLEAIQQIIYPTEDPTPFSSQSRNQARIDRPERSQHASIPRAQSLRRNRDMTQFNTELLLEKRKL